MQAVFGQFNSVNHDTSTDSSQFTKQQANLEQLLANSLIKDRILTGLVDSSAPPRQRTEHRNAEMTKRFLTNYSQPKQLANTKQWPVNFVGESNLLGERESHCNQQLSFSNSSGSLERKTGAPKPTSPPEEHARSPSD